MKIKVIENEKDKLKVEVDDLTFVNLLNDRIWQQNVGWSAYAVDHPYLSKPVLTVKAKNPQKACTDAAEQIIKDVASLKKKIK